MRIRESIFFFSCLLERPRRRASEYRANFRPAIVYMIENLISAFKQCLWTLEPKGFAVDLTSPFSFTGSPPSTSSTISLRPLRHWMLALLSVTLKFNYAILIEIIKFCSSVNDEPPLFMQSLLCSLMVLGKLRNYLTRLLIIQFRPQ